MANVPKIPKNISCQQLLTTCNVVRHGFLRRRSALNTHLEHLMPTAQIIRWSMVYAVLEGGCLYLFRDETSTKPSTATSLWGFTRIEVCDDEVGIGVAWPFKLVCDNDLYKKRFYFSSTTEADMHKWIECIQQQMNIANNVQLKSLIYSRERNEPKMEPCGTPHVIGNLQDCTLLSVSDEQEYDETLSSPTLSPSLPVAQAAAEKHNDSPAIKARPRLPPPPVEELQMDNGSDTEEGDDNLYDTVQETTSVTGRLKKMKKGLARVMHRSAVTGGGMENSTPEPVTVSPAAATNDQPLALPRALPPTPEAGNMVVSVGTPNAKPVSAVKPTPAASSKPLPKIPDSSSSSSGNNSSDVHELGSSPGKKSQSEEESDEEYVNVDVVPGMPRDLMAAAFWTKSATEGDEIMKALTDEGVYMLRTATGNPDILTLLVRTENAMRKYKMVKDQQGQFMIDSSGPRFTTVSSLLAYYMKNSLPHRQTTLSQPYSDVLVTSANR